MCDELPNLDKENFEVVVDYFELLKGKIFIRIGDFEQIVPVVKGGPIEQIKMACIQNSKYWPSF
jgi:hypothetical protein